VYDLASAGGFGYPADKHNGAVRQQADRLFRYRP
jgi:hypothetical protein